METGTVITRSAITPNQGRDRDEVKLLRIHAYLQMRVAFRMLYPSDRPGPYERNKALYEQAIAATPEEREAMAKVFYWRVLRSLAIGFLLIGTLAVLCRLR